MANRRGTKPRPFRFAAAIVAILLSADLAAGEGGRVLDDFRDPSRWTATASDSVRASLEPVDAPGGRGLCLDYDFNGVSGYAVARRKIEIGYPPNYAFDFQLRGEGPPNNLEFKLADAGGDNVWWVRKPDFTMPAQWTPQSFKKRMVGFAWGPTADRELHKSAALELTISAGKGGGKGRACIAGLRLRELPVDDGSPLVGSLARRGDGWTYDLGRVRELGGAILRWQAGPAGFGYGVALSGDGKGWRDVREVHDSDGGEDYIALPESEARYLRIRPEAGAPPLAGIEVQPLAFAATPNDFLRQVASRAPRGEYPRGFVGEQPYWTLLGVDGGHEQGLIGEDGAIELARGGPSIEPFVVSGGRLVTWADVESTQSLQDGDLPIPTVHWEHRDFGLDVTAFASGTPQRSQLVARYVLSNTTKQARDYVLALAARPFQVNPPSQFLSTPGGFSPIRKIFAREGVIGVDGPSIQSDQQSSAGIAATFDEGGIVQRLRNAKWSNACFDRTDTGSMGCDAFPRLRDTVDDPTGLASAALLYVIRLQPGESREIDWHSQLTGTPEQPPPPPPLSRAEDQAQTAAAWRRKLDAVRISLPPRAQPLVETLHTALAHILMSRDGPELRPGTRSYARSWIRDGAMMNDALLRLGRGDVAGAYVRWYAPYQFADGKVPCCVDARGSDPVPENDSQGELIHAIAQVYRYGRDRALLESQWPHVAGAVAYMDQLRSSERTEANRAKNAAFFGMMPASISHEGYSAKPMHSYWDDFWSLRGYDDAVEIARWLGRDADAARIAASRDQFRADLEASLHSATAQHGIGFLPGAAELGDFDPTSTTIALAPGDAQSWLPPDLLRNTFERYWTESVQRRDGKRVWKDYTPYELRTVGSFVRLGWRERANAMLDFFLAGQQPPGWRQWGEVVSSTPRKPFFLGDLPHAWVESDYIRSLLDMLAYERDGGRALVLAAGVPADWLASGIAVDGLRTPQGELHYALKRKGDALVWRIGAGMAPPAEGLILTWPLDTPPGETTVDGKPAQWKDGELRIDRLPAVVRARVH